MEDGIRTIIVVVVMGGGIVVLVSATAFACWGWYHRSGSIIFLERNSDAIATMYFIKVVKAAKKRLIIHDDGDNVAGTPYNDENVLEALAKRLEDYKELEVNVLFNIKDENLRIVQMAGKYDGRLRIRYKNERPKGDIHYKIADDTMGYFSEHDQGSSDRKIWLYDFTDATRKVRERAFGDHSRLFNREFAMTSE